jgi:hypothetical protein
MAEISKPPYHADAMPGVPNRPGSASDFGAKMGPPYPKAIKPDFNESKMKSSISNALGQRSGSRQSPGGSD